MSGVTPRGDNGGVRVPDLRALRAVLLAVAVAATSAGCGPSASSAQDAPGAGVVVRVTDGDTIRVAIAGREEQVRLIGVDTPETHGRGGLRECFGAEATARTSALLPPGTPVRLVRDAELRDRYDRLLAYVYRADDDLFVNLTLAREGYAAAYTFPPNVAHADEFVAAAAAAREAERGLWSACGGPDTAL